jgi:hypothetical protein
MAVTSSRFHKALEYWPFILLLIPTFFIAIPLLPSGSIIAADFPALQNAVHPSKVLYTWIDFGSRNDFEILSRYPIILAGFILELANVDPDITSHQYHSISAL